MKYAKNAKELVQKTEKQSLVKLAVAKESDCKMWEGLDLICKCKFNVKDVEAEDFLQLSAVLLVVVRRL